MKLNYKTWIGVLLLAGTLFAGAPAAFSTTTTGTMTANGTTVAGTKTTASTKAGTKKIVTTTIATKKLNYFRRGTFFLESAPLSFEADLLFRNLR